MEIYLTSMKLDDNGALILNAQSKPLDDKELNKITEYFVNGDALTLTKDD